MTSHKPDIRQANPCPPFDIIKPPPIKWVDKNVSGGFGILIDDVLAGVMVSMLLIMASLFF